MQTNNRSNRRDPEDESIGLQRTVYRSFVFVYVPTILLFLLSANFSWEVTKLNVSPETRTSWPLKFTLLDLSTTAALLGLTAGLLLARIQWANANRPSIGFAIEDEGANFKPDSLNWQVWLYNGGAGTGTIEKFQYVVRFTDQPASVPITLSELNRAMASRGLVDGDDYFIRWVSHGAPFVPISQFSNRTIICRFTIKALAEIEELDIVVRVKDSVGDTHERTLLIVDRLPSVTKTSVEKYRKEHSITS